MFFDSLGRVYDGTVHIKEQSIESHLLGRGGEVPAVTDAAHLEVCLMVMRRITVNESLIVAMFKLRCYPKAGSNYNI
jgi:hypothetical protein